MISYPAGTFNIAAVPVVKADSGITGGFVSLSEPGDGSAIATYQFSDNTYLLVNFTNLE